MSLRLDHHLWWRWWSEEEPRRLGHGSSESRGNGSSVRADFPHLESSPPPPEAFAAWVQFKPCRLLRCYFSRFVASLFLFLLLLWVASFFRELELLQWTWVWEIQNVSFLDSSETYLTNKIVSKIMLFCKKNPREWYVQRIVLETKERVYGLQWVEKWRQVIKKKVRIQRFLRLNLRLWKSIVLS